MAVTTDILAIWRCPARVFARRLARRDEAAALATLMGACFLMFVAQWPRLAREAHLSDGTPSLQELIGINLFAFLFIAPLVFYFLAFLAQLILRAIGHPVAPHGSRLALFWALLAIAPAALFQGLVAGLVGPGLGLTLVGLAVLAAFLWLWARLLHLAATEDRDV